MNKMKIFGIILGSIAILILISVATGSYRYIMAPFFGAIEQQLEIESGASRTYNYNWFFNKCSAIQSKELTLQHLMQEPNPTEMQRTNISGLIAARNSDITEYNARASAVGTQGRFRSDNLPERIPLGNFNGNSITVCN
jgi:hypothetical protein